MIRGNMHYNHEIHRLYEAVWRRRIKLELLPPEFLELVRQFPGLISLTLYQGDRVVALGGLLDGKMHHYLFCGMDYQRETDLYFNVFHQMDDALKRPTLIRLDKLLTASETVWDAPPGLFFSMSGDVAQCAYSRRGSGFSSRPPIPSFSIFKTEPLPKKTSGGCLPELGQTHEFVESTLPGSPVQTKFASLTSLRAAAFHRIGGMVF
jgi:hypothetical protein